MKIEKKMECSSPAAARVVRKKKMDNKKRFSHEQIKSLESMFQEETKLEPNRKLQLARDLGLHPRQVSIWFQNRRARSKSKQLERDYSVLRANHDALSSSFESLKKEKQSLLKQLQKLTDLLEKPPEYRWCSLGSVENGSNDGDSDNRESEEKPTLLLEERVDHRLVMFSDGVEKFGLEEASLLNNAETADGSLTVPEEEWCGFDSGCFSDQSSNSLPWWNLWP